MNVNVYRRFVVVLLINCCSLHKVLQRGASLQHLTFAILTNRAPDSIRLYLSMETYKNLSNNIRLLTVYF